MHDFTRDNWIQKDTDAKRLRVTAISDAELIREMESAAYLCSPRAYWGNKGPRTSYILQREIVRLEICRRGAAVPAAITPAA